MAGVSLGGGDMTVRFESNLKVAKLQLQQFVSGAAVKRAAVRAINKTAVTARADTIRMIREKVPLKAKLLRERVAIIRATNAQASPTAEVRASARGIGLEEFQARKTRTGVTAAFSAGRKLIRHAFFRKDKGGVWKRVAAAAGVLVDRLPIRRLFGPSARALFLEILPRELPTLTPVLEKRMAEELAFERRRVRG